MSVCRHELRGEGGSAPSPTIPTLQERTETLYNAAHALAAICDASFDWGCEPQVVGEGVVVGVGDGSPE